VPARIILCCAARGVGQGLEEELRDKVREWLERKKGEEPAIGVREKRAPFAGFLQLSDRRSLSCVGFSYGIPVHA